MMDQSDAELLGRYRTGEEAALLALLERHETSLYHFLVGILRDHHRAEDALQETFVKALEQLDTVDPEHLRGWLFTVAYHQAMLFKRRQKTRSALDLPADGIPSCVPSPLGLAEQLDDARRLRELLERLPTGQREVIHQRVYEGKRFKEIASALGCPLNTALARMHEGLKRLRLLWEQEHA